MSLEGLEQLTGNFRKKTIFADPSFISGKFHEISQGK